MNYKQKRNIEWEIKALERFLGLILPKSYKQFLRDFEGGYVDNKPIPGKPRIFGFARNKDFTSVVNATTFLRIKRDDLSADFLPISFFNENILLCLDLRTKQNENAALVKINWTDKNAPIEIASSTFSGYLKASINKYSNNN